MNKIDAFLIASGLQYSDDIDLFADACSYLREHFDFDTEDLCELFDETREIKEVFKNG